MSLPVAVRGAVTIPRLRPFGPWAVVTGASSGIGRALAQQLAAAGFSLVLVARRADALEALGRELADTFGAGTREVVADIATDEGLQAVADATRALDVGLFVANAGFGTSGAFLDADPAAESAMLATNCRALMLGTHQFARRFAQRGRGGIVLVSSILARQGTPWAAHYSATKAYVTALGEALRVELGGRGVDVLVTAPGPTTTGFAARARMSLGKAMTPGEVARATLVALGRRGHVWPGGLSKLLVWSMTGLPRAARVRIMGQVMRGMAQTA